MRSEPHPGASPVPLPMGEGKGVRFKDLTTYPERKIGARRLRRNETEAENILWQQLRNRKLEGLKFRRQFPIGPFFADFCCLERKLIVEVDGGQHKENRENDENRT